MAKNDNLTDFLTDVADAIREKTGDAALINPQDFSRKILSIETGGGSSAEVETNDVNFYDYDGTCLHSYSAADFLTLTELPPLPTHAGLICQEWNWDLADAQEYVAEYGYMEIGANYITDDGKTRLYIEIPTTDRMSFTLKLHQTVSNGVKVNWGDGSEVETLASSSYGYLYHTYTATGAYCITLEAVSGTYQLGYSNTSNNEGVFGGNSSTNTYVYCDMLKKVEIGASVTTIGSRTFYNCYNLETITVPKEIGGASTYAFNTCISLKAYIFPKNSFAGIYCFAGCYRLKVFSFAKEGSSTYQTNLISSVESLKFLCLPTSIKTIKESFAREYKFLERAVIPNSVTTIEGSYFCYKTGAKYIRCDAQVETFPGYAFRDSRRLERLLLPSTLTTIPAYFCEKCYNLRSIKIPSGVTSLGNYVFQYCYACACFDFSECVAVPTLGSNAFYGLKEYNIVVPDALYDSWIAATNWSSLASYIIKKSDWDASQA